MTMYFLFLILVIHIVFVLFRMHNTKIKSQNLDKLEVFLMVGELILIIWNPNDMLIKLHILYKIIVCIFVCILGVYIYLFQRKKEIYKDEHSLIYFIRVIVLIIIFLYPESINNF